MPQIDNQLQQVGHARYNGGQLERIFSMSGERGAREDSTEVSPKLQLERATKLHQIHKWGESIPGRNSRSNLMCSGGMLTCDPVGGTEKEAAQSWVLWMILQNLKHLLTPPHPASSF